MKSDIRILILEHDQADIDLLLRQLKKSGMAYEYVTVDNEDTFRKALDNFHPDIILSDYSLPTFDGVRAFNIKQQLQPQVPFIIVSGTIGEENAVELIKKGVTDYALKDKLFAVPHKIERALAEAEEYRIRLAAENKLSRFSHLLAESQAIAHIGSWEMDVTNQSMLWSDEAYRILGLPPNSTEPSLGLFIQHVHPEDSEFVKRLMTQIISSHREIPFHCRIVTQSGATRYVYCESIFERDNNGLPVRLIGIVHDVTDKKKAEDEIRSLNAHLEDKVKQRTAELVDANQQLEAFAYSVSHDLRSPLRSIHGFSQILRKQHQSRLNEDAASLLDMICDNTIRMQTLIDNMLTFSRAGRGQLNRTPLNMTELVEGCWKSVCESADIKADIKISPLPDSVGDKAMMTQVLINFLSNAAKYSSQKDNPLVEVGAEEKEDETVFFVKDNGAGFDMQYYDRLFGVFQRLHTLTEFEGTGVGLAIVKRIIEKHGGRVWAQSSPGQGAIFYFTLPKVLVMQKVG